MRILIVEDENRIANTIKKGLEQENYAVDVAYDGTEGFDLAISEEYDAIILDLMLPGMDGITICKQLRDKKNHTPNLILTAKSKTSDKITGLDSGADDYLAKPFSFDELVARIRALTRRPKQVLPAKFEVEDLSLDPSNFVVQRGDKKISLSSKEFALLEYLMRNAHKILSKDQIIGHIWNYEADILPNTVEVYIRNLRNKLGKPEIIQTVRGFGYRIGD